MRDPLVEYFILRSISLSEKILQSTLALETEIHCSHHEITYEVFIETLMRLKSFGLIVSSKDLLDYTRWDITEKGQKALKEFSRINNEQSHKN